MKWEANTNEGTKEVKIRRRKKQKKILVSVIRFFGPIFMHTFAFLVFCFFLGFLTTMENHKVFSFFFFLLNNLEGVSLTLQNHLNHT